MSYNSPSLDRLNYTKIDKMLTKDNTIQRNIKSDYTDSIILKDSYNDKELCEFADEDSAVEFVKINLKVDVSGEEIINISKNNQEFLGYKWSIGKYAYNLPKTLILSVQYSRQVIEDFLQQLKDYCKQFRYIIYRDNLIDEEFYSQSEVADYFKVSQPAIAQRLKKGSIIHKDTNTMYNIKKVNLKPAFEFELLDYKGILKYAKKIKEDKSYIDLLVDLDIDENLIYA